MLGAITTCSVLSPRTGGQTMVYILPNPWDTHIQADIHLHLIAIGPRGETRIDKETHMQADIHLHLIATGPRGETRI